MRTFGIGLLLLVPLLAACGGAPTGNGGDAAASVERYLTAMVNSERDTMAGLLCAELEAQLDMEAQRFATVSGVRLEAPGCTFDSATALVTCTGEIIATYGAADTNFPLASYRVVQEDGEWKYCGEG
jgi:hypothetical protein